MSYYWLHVNHKTDKARIHIQGGCHWVKEAVRRIQAGEPYGPIRGDENGYWEGTYVSLQEAQVAQEATGKTIRDRCRLCWR